MSKEKGNLPLSPRHVASLRLGFRAQKTVWSYLLGKAFFILAGRYVFLQLFLGSFPRRTALLIPGQKM